VRRAEGLAARFARELETLARAAARAAGLRPNEGATMKHIAFLGILLGSMAASIDASATNYVVTLTTDASQADPTRPNAGSLRWAVAQANLTAARDQIIFAFGAASITVSSQLNISQDLGIDGRGKRIFAKVSGGKPLFRLASGQLDVTDLDVVAQGALQTGPAVMGLPGTTLWWTNGDVSGFTVPVFALNDSEIIADRLTAFSNTAGVISVSAGDAWVTNSKFTNNTSSLPGGAISAKTSNLLLTGVTFKQNRSTNDGGAIYAEGGGMIDGLDLEFDGNEGTHGGALFAQGYEVRLQMTAMVNNTATTNDGLGGGIFASDSYLDITLARFVGNAAAIGGAMFLYDFNTAPKSIRYASFEENEADLQGGGIALSSASGVAGELLLENVTMVGNYAADDGSDLIVTGVPTTDVVLRHCTLADGDSPGSAVVTRGLFSLGIFNSILEATTKNCDLQKKPNDISSLDSDETCTFSDVDSVVGVSALLEPPGPYYSAMLTLPPTGASPAVDSADPAECDVTWQGGVAGDGIDMEGHARPSGAGCEMGAIELP
jgi:predicted outer membrane repeat protein